jgi:hypothetical protein
MSLSASVSLSTRPAERNDAHAPPAPSVFLAESNGETQARGGILGEFFRPAAFEQGMGEGDVLARRNVKRNDLENGCHT